MAGLRTALRDGPPLVGAWLQLESPMAAEIAGRLGFDWVGIDTQHGLIGYDGMLRMLQALSIGGTPALVRVPSAEPAAIGRALDSGAAGVIVPLVETAEQAVTAVAACRYPPAGRRSWGPIRLALAGGYTPQEADRDVACIVMVETRRGAEAAAQIAAVEGVDGVLIGPSDLALSLGGAPTAALTDAVNAPFVRPIFDACAVAGVAVGAIAPSPAHVAAYLDAGCQLVSAYRDVQGMTAAAAEALAAARAASGGRAPGAG
ncbi:HpcH/HpaI aldolase/citrate lyase family protein [Conexibacter sp. CPCC 206217]|uniref:HpcH/HpaI aldolase family protein n=1 Tax=Conexibacter sp. CPCC 206217 TaxID=3064574 RepID=UPI0027269035|nr:aldolase/citrate lyase family protein [Conexibacter sp. CPCC 206217]MDO8210230.1 aldolase/citrate lyase family protein [Conexibacter sp. CPCC 206217]